MIYNFIHALCKFKLNARKFHQKSTKQGRHPANNCEMIQIWIHLNSLELTWICLNSYFSKNAWPTDRRTDKAFHRVANQTRIAMMPPHGLRQFRVKLRQLHQFCVSSSCRFWRKFEIWRRDRACVLQIWTCPEHNKREREKLRGRERERERERERLWWWWSF